MHKPSRVVVFTHDALGGGLHQFKFPSQSRRGVRHSLLVDVSPDALREERARCTCDAAMFGKLCRHVRWLLHGPKGVTS